MDTTLLPHGGIVVGIDGSEAGDRAIAWAATEAALDHRPLVLVHAIGSLGNPGSTRRAEGDHLVQEMRDRGEDILAAAAAGVAARHPSVDVLTSVVTEDARPALVDLTREASLVVVGSRGRGPVRSRLLGSVSRAVVRHAWCPVVVVRPHHPGTVRRGVLVGADGTAGSRPTLEFAYREASVHRLPLAVMHCVWEAGSSTASRVADRDDPDLEEARLRLAESIAGMTEKYPDVHVTVELDRGSPEQCLGAAADRMDLLVVGRRHGGALSHAVVGDVATYLVEHAGTVVAVVPDVTGPTHLGDGTSSPERPSTEPEG